MAGAHNRQTELSRFIGRLNRAKLDWDAQNVADYLWLANYVKTNSAGTLPSDTVDQPIENSNSQKNFEFKSSDFEPLPLFSSQIASEQPDSTAEKTSSKGSRICFSTPTAPALRKTLGIGRSLRPLMRKVSSYARTELDEMATAEQTAERKFCMTVVRPARERWLEVALVIENSAASFLWTEAIRDFQQVLERQGAFRKITVWNITTVDDEPQLFSGSLFHRRKKPRSFKELVDISGRRLILIASDCTSLAWRTGRLHQVCLKIWADHGPMAVVQLLPGHLWKRTVLNAGLTVKLGALLPGVANDKLAFRERPISIDTDFGEGVKLPVITLEPDSLNRWAKVVAGYGGNWTTGVWFDPGWQMSLSMTDEVSQDISADQLVQRFMTTASSDLSIRLAGLMALTPVELPIIYLIQKTMLPTSTPLHIAEVFMSGLIQRVEGNSSISRDNINFAFDFAPEVRDLLISTVPTASSEAVLDRVSQYIGERIGKSIYSFTALLQMESEVSSEGELRQFATITRQTLERIGGNYKALVAKYTKEESMTIPHNTPQRDLLDTTLRLSSDPSFESENNSIWRGHSNSGEDRIFSDQLPARALSLNTAPRFNPFGEADCESEVKRLKKDYSRYFFYNTQFNYLALDPDVFLVVGRRGSGKTALSHFFSFQKMISEAIAIDVDQPPAFEQVLEEITLKAPYSREIAIPRIATIWHLVVWSVIFRELQDFDPRIRTACIFGSREGKLSTFIRHFLKALLDRLVKSDDDLLDELEDIFADSRIRNGMSAVLEIAKKRPVIVAFDTLENYAIHDPTMMRATAALIQCGSEFNRDFAHQGVHIKIFVMAEVFPHLKEEVILNRLKSVRNEVYMHWRPKDLMRLISWRFYNYLQAMDLLLPESRTIDWDSSTDVLEKMWYPYFGRTLRNEQNLPERTFPYLLRHTQMRPRQLIVLCNAIAQQAIEKKTFPRFHSDTIVSAVQSKQIALAEEVINSYSSVYPKVGRILEALSGIPIIFKGNQLDRRAPITASEWSGEYSPHSFRQLVSELGIIGRVRHLNSEAGYAEADFEYGTESRLPLLSENICAVHPMFYGKLNVSCENRIRVYPFPDHEDFRPWRMEEKNL